MNKWVALALALTGVTLVVAGVLMPFAFKTLLDQKLDHMLALTPDSPIIENFIAPPFPFYLKMYFFNVTNKDEILKGFKPRVQEVGPFSYVEKHRKENIKWDNKHNTVAYRKNETFFFMPHLSEGLTEDTLITTINPVMLALASLAEDPAMPQAAHALLEIYLWRFNMEPFITRTAGELLYNGYDEDILRALASFTKNPVHATGKFGFFYPKNNSWASEEKVNTGVGNISQLLNLVEFKGKPLTAWKTDSCNQVKGNVAAPFPRPIDKNANLLMFSTGLCRTVFFNFREIINFKGLSTYRFVLPYEVMAKSKENECFCSDAFTCRDSMTNLAPCIKGVPMIASYPHFYMGSPEDINAIDGLHPVQEYHESYVDIEPTTGISVKAQKGVQMNMPLRRYLNLPALSRVQEVIFPILWMQNSAEAPPEAADIIFQKALLPGIIVVYVCYFLIAIGLLIILIILVIYCKGRHCNKKTKKKNIVMNGEKTVLKEPFIKK